MRAAVMARRHSRHDDSDAPEGATERTGILLAELRQLSQTLDRIADDLDSQIGPLGEVEPGGD